MGLFVGFGFRGGFVVRKGAVKGLIVDLGGEFDGESKASSIWEREGLAGELMVGVVGEEVGVVLSGVECVFDVC